MDTDAGTVLDPADHDAVVRTVLTEAASNDPDGWGAVANTIKNRLAQGGYGDTPAAIVTAPGQFEVWSNGRAQKVDASSPQYAAASRVVDAVMGGKLPDNTNGATNFFSPGGQAALGRSAPAWAQNPTASVGGQLFYAPQGRVTYQQAPGGATPSSAPDPAPISFGGEQNPPDPGPAPAAGAPAAPAPSSPADPGTAATLARWGVGSSGSASAAAPAAPVGGAPAQSDASATFARWGVQPAAAGSAPAAAAPATAAAQAGPTSGAPISFASPDVQTSGAPPAATDKGVVGATAMGALNGIPIVGPGLLDLGERGAAAVSMLRGAPGSFEDNLARVKADAGATDAAHPAAKTVGNIGGAVIGMAPALAAAPEAFGVGGGNMALNMLKGGVTNALIGGADSAARGENPLTGAIVGGAAGGIAPPVGRFVGNALGGTFGGAGSLLSSGVNKLMTGASSGIPGVSMPAAKFALGGLASDGLDNAGNALTRLGDQGMLADTGPGARGVTAAMLKPGTPEASVVTNALTGRAAAAGDRIANALDTNLGPYRSAQAATDELAAERSALAQGYAQVHAAAPPVDVTGVVQDIDSRLATATGAQRRALEGVRNELVAVPAGADPITSVATPESYVTNSRQLQNVRQDLDAVINYGAPGLGVEQGAVVRNQASLRDVRGALDAALKAQVPGLADLDAQSSALARQAEAVETGTKVFGASGPDPETLATQRAAMSPDEQAAQNLGARAAVDRMFGRGTQRSVVGLNKLIPAAAGEDGYNAQNLATMFGQDQANALGGVLDRERTFDATTNDLVGKSNTNRLAAAQKLGDESAPGSLNLLPASGTGLALQAGKKLVVDPLMRIILSNPNASRNLEVARMMTAQGADAQTILAQLTRLNGQMQGASGLGNALSGSANALVNVGTPALGDTSQNYFGANALTGAGQRR